jgi:hypothetical protein
MKKLRWSGQNTYVIEAIPSTFIEYIIPQIAEKSIKIGILRISKIWKLTDAMIHQRTVWNCDPYLANSENKILSRKKIYNQMPQNECSTMAAIESDTCSTLSDTVFYACQTDEKYIKPFNSAAVR